MLVASFRSLEFLKIGAMCPPTSPRNDAPFDASPTLRELAWNCSQRVRGQRDLLRPLQGRKTEADETFREMYR